MSVEASTPLVGPARDLALEVLIHGPLSRRELARRLDVSAATMTRVSSQLLELGILAERDEPLEGLLGRPARPLDIVTDARHFLGMKLTATHVHGVLTNLRAEPQASYSEELPDTDPDTVTRVVGRVADHLQAADVSPTAIGISLGGQSLDHRVVHRAPFLHWTDVPLAHLVESHTGLPTVIENDVVALTGAEHWFGEVRTLDRFAVITIGAGVGYGLVIHDRVVTTPDVGVGLLGHHPLEPTGPLCPHGHRGCAEALLSIPGVEAEASVAFRRDVPYADLLALAEQKEPLAVAIVEQSARALGRLVAAVANIAMAQHVLVTGEGVDLARVGTKAMYEGVLRDRDPAATPVEVTVKPDNIDDWARGAAAIAIQHHVLDGMRS